MPAKKSDHTILTTPRLRVRRLQLSDYPDYFRLEGDPAVMHFITGRARSAEECYGRLVTQIRNYKKLKGLGIFGVCSQEGDLLGLCNINPMEGTAHIHIGYKIFPEYQGQGLATELASALIQYGFAELKLENLTAITHPANIASQRVLLKAGLHRQGSIRFRKKECSFFSLNKAQFAEPGLACHP